MDKLKIKIDKKILYKGGDDFCYFSIDKDNTVRNYYKVISGMIWINENCSLEYRSVYARKLIWVLKRTDLVPIDDFKDRKFYHVDVYKLEIDEKEPEFKVVSRNFYDFRLPECPFNNFQSTMRHNSFRITDAEKTVKYFDPKDRFTKVDFNSNVTMQTIIDKEYGSIVRHVARPIVRNLRHLVVRKKNARK